MSVSARAVVTRTRLRGLLHCVKRPGGHVGLRGSKGLRRSAGASERKQKDHTSKDDNSLVDGRGDRESHARLMDVKSLAIKDRGSWLEELGTWKCGFHDCGLRKWAVFLVTRFQGYRTNLPG
jgi:hypothetical protein